MASSADRSVIARNVASHRSVAARRSARPAADRSGQRASCACSPIVVAKTGFRSNVSARNASTVSANVAT